MNEILAGIYGTGGFEKKANANGEPLTLSDLALMMLVDGTESKQDIEKLASVHEQVLGQLADFDRAGRAMSHYEFSEMEKKASEGDDSELREFLGAPASEDGGKENLKNAIREELKRRIGA